MELVQLFSALAHPLRIRLVSLLLQGELCVCELEEILSERQANISKHLLTLKEAGLVEVRRAQQRAFYTVTKRLRKEALLVAYVEERRFNDVRLKQDTRRFIEHEARKDTRTYVCNRPEGI